VAIRIEGSTTGFQLMLFDAATAAQDIIVDGNAWDGGASLRIKSSCPLKHVVWRNNTLASTGLRFEVRPEAPNWNIDEYCAWEQNYCTTVTASSGALPAFPVVRDSYIVNPVTGAGPNYLRNASSAASAAKSGEVRLVNPAIGDFRPAGPLVQPENRRSRLRPLDGRGNLRSPTEAVGAWAQGYTAPNWPF
jgi:hypothetical protein